MNSRSASLVHLGCYEKMYNFNSNHYESILSIKTRMHSSRNAFAASRSIRRGWGRACLTGGGMRACVPRGCMLRTPHPVNRMTDAYENITLPQTSFAGGNKFSRLLRQIHVQENVDNKSYP